MEIEERENENIELLLPETTIVTHCIYKNDLERLVKSFEDDADPYQHDINELINERDIEGKLPVDVSASFGRIDITRELIKRGADVNATTEKGYSCLHHAAAWGHVDVLRLLVEFKANLQQCNCHGEKARDTAARYKQIECVEFLDWAEAKEKLIQYIHCCQETVLDPEKNSGKFTKEEKVLIISSCKEKLEWIDCTEEVAHTQDFIAQKQALGAVLEPILLKISEASK